MTLKNDEIKNKIKKILRIIVKVVFVLYMIISLPIVFIVLYYLFDNVGYCLEHDGVWDSHQKICRKDCLAWSEKNGCIPFDQPEKYYE